MCTYRGKKTAKTLTISKPVKTSTERESERERAKRQKGDATTKGNVIRTEGEVRATGSYQQEVPPGGEGRG